MRRVLGNIWCWFLTKGIHWTFNPALAPVIFLIIVGGIHAATN